MAEISCEELNEKLKSKQKPFLLDVRHSWEWVQGHLPNAVLISLSELPARINELPLDKKTEIITYCQHGARSLRAFLFLQSLGYENVKLLKGSFEVWQHKGFPIERQ